MQTVAPPPPPPSLAVASDPSSSQAVAAEPELVDDTDPGPIPVSAADPWRGRRDAPVTIVMMGDFQCPFCARAVATLAQLRQSYGDEKLRIVWKYDPLPFHNEARALATVAMALFERLGNDAFWQAHDAFYGDQARLGAVAADAAARAGTSLEELRASASWGRAEAKVDADAALAKRVGATGTPAFFINGIHLSGAQPYERFAQVIDEQLVKARDLVARGTLPRRVYAGLTKAQQDTHPQPSPSAPPKPPEDDHKVYRVPVGTSPVHGKASALVTMVEIAEFQCPFCGKAAPTLQTLVDAYGDKLRIVFKHNPLPFHPRAEPAAELALEARAEKGDKGFWAAHDLLFAKECSGSPKAPNRQACMDAGGTWMDNQVSLADPDLLRYAKALGLDAAKVSAAISAKKYAATIDEDQDLADEVGASGTPTFFINGRRLVGAQPVEKFREIIDEELAKAIALVKAGTPAARVYATIEASAVDALEKKTVPPPGRNSPSRGPANAKVVVQMFGDFQCPFTKRALPAIEELEKAFPGKVRLVWMNLPLSNHKDAEPAAEAAMEAYRQQGDKGFWAMHALLFAGQGQFYGLERPALDGYAAQIGLDPAQFAAALDGHTHQARVQADAKIAADAHISGTPSFVINGYFVSGARPVRSYRRIVARALAEAR